MDNYLHFAKIITEYKDYITFTTIYAVYTPIVSYFVYKLDQATKNGKLSKLEGMIKRSVQKEKIIS